MKTEPNDAAFASAVAFGDDGQVDEGSPGLTKREWFAGNAMQGLLSDPTIHDPEDCLKVGTVAVKYAELAIAALNAEPES